MYEGTVTRAFRDKHTREYYRVGDTFRSNELERMQELSGMFIEFEAPEPNDDPPQLKSVGGGWYELPNGERVRGKEAALQALAELDATTDGEGEIGAPGDDDSGPGEDDGE